MSWKPDQPLPEQVADAFAVVYDWVEVFHFETIENHDLNPLDDPAFRSWKIAVSKCGDKTPLEFNAVIDFARALDNEINLVRVLYGLLLAIDRGLQHQHPTFGSSQSLGNGKLLAHYFRFAQYNTDSIDGYVLPKWTTRSFRGTTFANHFENLVRANVNRDAVRVIARTPRAFRRRKLGNPTVRVVPFLYKLFDDDLGLADVTFSGVTVRDRHYFEMRHNSNNLQSLESRIVDSVEAIRQSGASIAIFPELVLDEHLLSILRNTLYATSLKHPELLEWVIVGNARPSSETLWPSTNEACVLDGTGNVVTYFPPSGTKESWIQLKHHRYKLTKDEQQRYGIENHFDESHDREESIAIGREHYFFEDRAGRYSVIICEDWGQVERALVDIRKLICRVVFVIVMDGPVEKGRWASDEASSYVTQTGGYALVANSLLLPNSPQIRAYRGKKCPPIADPYPAGPQNVGILAIPQEEDGPEKPLKFFTARAMPDPDNVESFLSEKIEIPIN